MYQIDIAKQPLLIQHGCKFTAKYTFMYADYIDLKSHFSLICDKVTISPPVSLRGSL